MIFVIAAVMVAAMCGLHWYLWKRLVRDVSAPGGRYRRVGTVAAIALPLVTTATVLGELGGVPFGLRQVMAWPGFLWFASLLYLIPCLLIGEALRPLLLRWLRARANRDIPIRVAPKAAEAPVPAAEPVAVPGGKAPDATDDGGHRARSGVALAEEAAAVPAAASGGSGPSRPEADDAAELGRRRFVARSVAVGSALVTAGTVGYGTYAARQLTTKHVTVRLAHLPRAAHGYRITVASDIHLGPIAGSSHCRRVVDAINDTQPDLVTVVGDLVDADVADLRSAAAPLAELQSREGSFFVTGNHEYHVDPVEWVTHVRELGLVPLENERRELPYFDLAGVNDLEGEGTDHGGPDFGAALADRDRQRTSVLMSHQPATIYDAVDFGVDLQLSGHTHGGQLWPLTYVAAQSNPTLAGLERYGDTQLYVTRGAGAWGPPVRVGADPDITVVTLASPEA
jgi:uncharacterized protein